MKSIPFNLEKDMAPIPFTPRHIEAAKHLKRCGLLWTPHVGCFVWDSENHIKMDSPFPKNIYFILSLTRFIAIFGSIDTMQKKLVWLPTWHQARLLVNQMGLGNREIGRIFRENSALDPGDELLIIYSLLNDALKIKTS